MPASFTQAGDITGELGERSFHYVGFRIDVEITLDHDFGRGGHVKVHGLAFDEFHRRAANCANHVVFADSLGDG